MKRVFSTELYFKMCVSCVVAAMMSGCFESPDACQSNADCFLGEECSAQRLCVVLEDQDMLPPDMSEDLVDAGDMSADMAADMATPGCTFDEECGDGLVCGATGQCEPDTSGKVQCSADLPCEGGAPCVGGFCEPESTCAVHDGSCGTGYECNLETGLCQVLPPWEFSLLNDAQEKPTSLAFRATVSALSMASFTSDTVHVTSNSVASLNLQFLIENEALVARQCTWELQFCTSAMECIASAPEQNATQLSWTMSNVTIPAGEETYLFYLSTQCPEPQTEPPFTTLQNSAATLSFDFSRTSQDVSQGYFLQVPFL